MSDNPQHSTNRCHKFVDIIHTNFAIFNQKASWFDIFFWHFCQKKWISRIQFTNVKCKHFVKTHYGTGFDYDTAVCFSGVISSMILCKFVFFHLDYSFSPFRFPHLKTSLFLFFYNFYIFVQKSKSTIFNTSYMFNVSIINLKSLSQISE